MIRIAAVGDLHYDHDRRETLKEHFDRLSDCADLFLIAGDLTQSGALEEARALADDLRRRAFLMRIGQRRAPGP